MLLSCRYVTKDNSALMSSSRKQTYNGDVLSMKSPFHNKQLSLHCNSRCSSCCNINSSNNKNKDSDRFLSSQKEILGLLNSNSNNLTNSNIKRSISQKIQRMQNEVSCRSIFNRNDYDTKRYQSVDKKKDDLTMKGIIRNRITRMLNKDKGNYVDKRNVSYKHKFMFHQSSMNKYNTRSQFLYSFTNNIHNTSNNNNNTKQTIMYPKKYYNGKLINDIQPKPNAYQLLFNNTTTTNGTSTSNLRLNLINLSNI